ncbi:hypothetical protein PR048_025634 [Dryococelus australis]|uniref:RNA-directed DNA polymerase n=1 Tax=Dryococelus australis TaxID=614101 RepID=A0ABQ9GRX8_9NEOP|nr:hypothetical protein PR048_025634 [Dryococelus australis]
MFDPKKEITLQCNTSQHGVKCCLLQKSSTEASSMQMEITASRCLTDRSPRLQCLRLKLLKYTHMCTLHLTDGMSCIPLPETEKDHDIVETIHSLSAHLPMIETLSFPVYLICIKVIGQLPASFHQNVRHNDKVLDSLHVEDKMVFLGSKIVVPTALQPYVLNIAHEGHGGVEKTKSRARHLFYWHLMSTDIEQYVSRCWTCEKFQRANGREPLIPHTIPRLPYLKEGADILEEAGNAYLVLID